jgi:hypothetical protein
MGANLFQSLFSYRPGGVLTPEENFLTEGFAYTLKSEAEIGQAWARHVLERSGRTCKFDTCRVETQESFRRGDGGGAVFPDMVMRCSDGDRETYVILSEHKWRSPTNREQLRTYRNLLADCAERSCLAFIGATVLQRAEALPECDAAFLWEDVYQFLNPFADGNRMVREFTEFLQSQELGPQEPLSLGIVAAYTYAQPVPGQCLKIIQRLADEEWPWDFLPGMVRAQRQPQGLRWGRVVLEFGSGDWHPGVAAGFLLDGSDHRLDLCDKERGFDLMFLIEARPPGTNIKGPAIQSKAGSLRKRFSDVTVTDQNEAKSRWRKLVVRKPLANVIHALGSEDAQVQAIYRQFEEWCTEIFADGTMEAAFRETWPIG